MEKNEETKGHGKEKEITGTRTLWKEERNERDQQFIVQQ